MDTPLSQEEIRILKIFYRHNKIKYKHLKFYRINEDSDFLCSLLTKKYIARSDYSTDSHSEYGTYTHTNAYKLTPEGAAAYETTVKEADNLYWTNFRSWLAIGISIIAIIVSALIGIFF